MKFFSCVFALESSKSPTRIRPSFTPEKKEAELSKVQHPKTIQKLILKSRTVTQLIPFSPASSTSEEFKPHIQETPVSAEIGLNKNVTEILELI